MTPKYDVYLMVPYCKWSGVDALTEDEAIDQCEPPPEFDSSEIHSYLALEHEEDTE